MNPGWNCVLELDSSREITAGNPAALAAAIDRGADLRIYTEFRHNEHIDTASDSTELIREVAEFGVTYLLDNRWAAGIMSLRQPISLPADFGPRPSMSFFLYNQDGRQAVARPHLDCIPATGSPGSGAAVGMPDMPKYHTLDSWDDDTNAPSRNFIYDFEVFRYNVRDDWREVLGHDATGNVEAGSVDDLADAFSNGCSVKIAVRDLCCDLGGDTTHELFVQSGSNYYYTEQKLFIAGSHPIIRVRPNIPLTYTSRGWDFGWLMARTDGRVVYRRCDPYSLEFSDIEMQCALRWFVR